MSDVAKRVKRDGRKWLIPAWITLGMVVGGGIAGMRGPIPILTLLISGFCFTRWAQLTGWSAGWLTGWAHGYLRGWQAALRRKED